METLPTRFCPCQSSSVKRFLRNIFFPRVRVVVHEQAKSIREKIPVWQDSIEILPPWPCLRSFGLVCVWFLSKHISVCMKDRRVRHSNRKRRLPEGRQADKNRLLSISQGLALPSRHLLSYTWWEVVCALHNVRVETMSTVLCARTDTLFNGLWKRFLFPVLYFFCYCYQYLVRWRKRNYAFDLKLCSRFFAGNTGFVLVILRSEVSEKCVWVCLCACVRARTLTRISFGLKLAPTHFSLLF